VGARYWTWVAVGCVAVALAIGSAFFFAPFDVGTNASDRGTVAAAIVSAFALIVSAIALLVTVRVQGSDHQAEERVRVELAILMSSVRSMLTKSAWEFADVKDSNHLAPRLDGERKSIDDFLSSTSAVALWAWIGKRSQAAGEGVSEEWRIFFKYLLDLLKEDAAIGMVVARSLGVERLLTSLSKRDIRLISSYVSDLASAGENFRLSREHDPFLAAALSLLAPPEDPAQQLRQLQYLKESGIDDPEVDLWLALLESGPTMNEEVEQAVGRGADPSKTANAVLAKHASALADFTA
jgi:hypothetical protein